MEAVFAGLVGLFFAVAIYLMLSGFSIRIMLGIAILGNAVNLLLFTAGRVTREVPPIIPAGADTLSVDAANPLPQALILTAIVISFSFLAFLLVLTYRVYQDLKTDNTGEMRVAEPDERPMPPLGY
ncbi:Na+/H+ antiporter subunit C [Agrobacterium sp. SHOUNA12C]|uniref:Na+/H+ antiporter subunit C n=1 Tax=Rhizobium rhizogenes TaxID=359 RepID=UPI00080FBA93|nr:Na+/H+ antiporter subunit C [Rhizobium rhizogenes]MCJ9722848.1 Na+/H+ antiporter subunit C [Agrobacterium sp. BETTINA12B]MCJ9761177.1 Na+/H+ antiporter subunit C [Agrobacterium sp. SHOUNA12C]OCJ02881.1 cation:proton antiporter [Agrobacterium sp. 13-626]NTG40427.1 Na+/H+ antiporter subunit C [Rhizobium rhizogenes]NTH44725.1 Na+/H+ antiporter subunit C [Rhizobium rhizogenes]